MTRMPRLGIPGILLLLAVAGPAQAAPRGKACAMAKLKAAKERIQANQCARALELLDEGYACHKTYVFPLLKGVCYRRLDRPAEAAKAFRQALHVGKGAMSARHWQLAKQGLEWSAMRFRYDKVTVVTEPPAGVVLTLDGVSVGTSPLRAPLVANVGRHTLRGKAPGRRETSVTFTAKGGGTMTVKLTLPRAAARGTEPRNPRTVSLKVASKKSRPKSSTAGNSRAGRIMRWSALGAAVLGAVLLVPGITYLAIHGDDAGAAESNPYLRRRYDTFGQGMGLTVTGSILVAGAAVLYGVSYLFPSSSGKGTEHAVLAPGSRNWSVAVGPGAVDLKIRF